MEFVDYLKDRSDIEKIIVNENYYISTLFFDELLNFLSETSKKENNLSYCIMLYETEQKSINIKIKTSDLPNHLDDSYTLYVITLNSLTDSLNTKIVLERDGYFDIDEKIEINVLDYLNKKRSLSEDLYNLFILLDKQITLKNYAEMHS